MKKTLVGLFSVIAVLFGMSACNLEDLPTVINYENSSKYTAGGATITAEIRELEVNWVAGDIKIVKAADNKISFSETAVQELDSDTTLYYWIDGKILHIQPCKSGYSGSTDRIKKTLTLFIPAAAVYDEFTVNSVSADATIDLMNAKKFTYDGVSGNVELKSSNVSEKIYANTVSGDITLDTDNAPDIYINTVSGESEIWAVKFTKMKCNSVSGSFYIHVPSDASFKCELDTVSGEMTCTDFTGTQVKNCFTVGTGESHIDINTVSGDVKVKKTIR